jgi:hypothetical protein
MVLSRTPGPARRGAGCLAAVAVALGASGAPAHASTVRDLWSTVNICDTKKNPDRLGIRARMPGNGTHQKMWMRFIAEYKASGGSWKMAKNGKSSWQYAGSALYTYQEFGWTFKFAAPPPGTGYTMRGLVQFEWRLHGNLQQHAHRYTSANHPSQGADPKGYSAANCWLSN